MNPRRRRRRFRPRRRHWSRLRNCRWGKKKKRKKFKKVKKKERKKENKSQVIHWRLLRGPSPVVTGLYLVLPSFTQFRSVRHFAGLDPSLNDFQRTERFFFEIVLICQRSY